MKQHREYDRKAIMAKYKDCCANCGIKNYSVGAWKHGNDEWIINKEVEPLNYESSRDAATTLNENQRDRRWIVIVLNIHKINEGYVPVCAMCTGKTIVERKPVEKDLQSQLF